MCHTETSSATHKIQTTLICNTEYELFIIISVFPFHSLLFIQSFSSLLYDRSTTSSKTNFPKLQIQCFPINFRYFPFSLRLAATYVFFIVFQSFLYFLQQRVLEGSFYARCDPSSYPSLFLLYVIYSYP